MFAASLGNSVPRLRVLVFLGVAMLVGCSHQDGVVGIQPLSEAGAGSVTPGFSDDFADNSAGWETQNIVPGSTTTFGLGGRARA